MRDASLRLQIAAACFCCLTWWDFAVAGAFQVAPIRVNLNAETRSAVLTVQNEGAEDSLVQVDAVSWTQEGGEDHYQATRELLVTPPIFKVPAGGSQIVRVGLRRLPESHSEVAYRIFVQEVPPETSHAGEVRVALRFGVPVFFTPSGMEPRQSPAWSARLTAGGDIRLGLANQGNQHLQIVALTLSALPDDTMLATQQKMTYLLPGQAHEWVLHPARNLAAGARLKLSARTDRGEINAEIILEQP